MKITVDLSDFWFESDDENLQVSIKNAIASKVKNEVLKNIEVRVTEQITREVKDSVEKSLYKHITKTISSCLKTVEMPPLNHGDEKTSLEDWIKHQFTKASGWSAPKDVMEKLAVQFGKELKERYDAMFATQIVMKMSEQGLLKDGMKELLLGE